MKNFIQQVLRQPVLLVGLITATIGLLVAFGVDVSDDQAAAILLFVGAIMALVSRVVTPAKEVVAQLRPGKDEPVKAGAAATDFGLEPGTVVSVEKNEPPYEDPV